MRTSPEELLEAKRSVGVIRYFVPYQRIVELIDHVEESLGRADYEGRMAGPTSGRGRKRGHGPVGKGGFVQGEDADEVCAEIGHDQEVAGGVENRLVRVGSLLALGVDPRSGQLEDIGLDGREAGRIGDVECVDTGSLAVRQAVDC